MEAAKNQKRYRTPVTLYLTREEHQAMRSRALQMGLQFKTWLTRVALEEMEGPARLPMGAVLERVRQALSAPPSKDGPKAA
jgi:hypothetical protein